MHSSVSSLIFQGLTPIPVTIEISTHQGIPKIVMTGLAEKVVKESRERILSSLKAQKIKFKSCRTVFNLIPADIPKKSQHLELGMVAALLSNYQLVKFDQKDCFFGRLGLDGTVRSVPHIFALVLKAKQAGFKRVFLPDDDLQQVKMINHIKLVPIKNIGNLLSSRPNVVYSAAAQYSVQPQEFALSLADVVDQPQAKQGLILAAAGGHHSLFTGPPGCGKTLMAQALQSILPPLNYDQALEVSFLHSLAQSDLKAFMTAPPVVAPHHLVTPAKLLGGGNPTQPGLITLAHRGILFLDEFNLFKTAVLEGLIRPLTEGLISIDRVGSRVTYPAQFILIAAHNPCPCGFYGTNIKPCKCSPLQRARYQQKIPGAILDRIDLFLNIAQTEANKLLSAHVDCLNISDIKRRIEQARQLQAERYKNLPYKFNARLTGPQVRQYLSLNSKCEKLLTQACQRLKLSNRALFKVIKVAQTLADLDNSATIKCTHIQESLSYRHREF